VVSHGILTERTREWVSPALARRLLSSPGTDLGVNQPLWLELVVDLIRHSSRNDITLDKIKQMIERTPKTAMTFPFFDTNYLGPERPMHWLFFPKVNQLGQITDVIINHDRIDVAQISMMVARGELSRVSNREAVGQAVYRTLSFFSLICYEGFIRSSASGRSLSMALVANGAHSDFLIPSIRLNVLSMLPDVQGLTPLHMMVIKGRMYDETERGQKTNFGQKAAFDQLVKDQVSGSSVTERVPVLGHQDRDGFTALHYAALRHDQYMAEMLVKAKPDLRYVKNSRGQTAFDVANLLLADRARILAQANGGDTQKTEQWLLGCNRSFQANPGNRVLDMAEENGVCITREFFEERMSSALNRLLYEGDGVSL
jgi:hypothetical protein